MILLSPQWTLALGIILSFFIGSQSPLKSKAKAWSTKLLQFSVILLGPSLNFHSVIKEGTSGLLITFISISLIFILGYLGKKIFDLEKNLSLLITMGTAICGGSAIGALAPIISASSIAITISIGIVFLLNALAVFIFPPIGHLLSLTQSQFGIWAALAIHDTSSVVAASSIYGQQALEIATTVKLTRALWIIPITLLFSFKIMKDAKNDNKNKMTIPWFIFGFLLMSLTFTFIENLLVYKHQFQLLSKSGFALTLFLIGITFDINKIKQVGLKPLLFAVVLWIIVSSLSLIYVIQSEIV